MFFKVTVNGTPYHKSCFKCSHGGCTISPSNYIAQGKLYCNHHHIQLFKEKGNYSQLETDRQENPMTKKLTSMEIAAESQLITTRMKLLFISLLYLSESDHPCHCYCCVQGRIQKFILRELNLVEVKSNKIVINFFVEV